MGLIERTIKAGFWQSITIFAHALLQIGVIAILARLISPEEFGIFAIVSVLSAFMLFVSEAGFGPSLIFQRNLTSGHLNAAFTSTIALSFVSATGLWLAAPKLGLFFENEQLTEVVRWISVSIPFNVFGNVSKSLLERELQFKKIMWANTSSFVVGYALVAITLASLGMGVWSLVVATICETVLLSLIYFFLSPHAISFRFGATHFRELFLFGSGATLGRFFNFLSTRADLFIVSKALDAAQVGIYERMLRVVDLPGRYVGGLLSKILFPAMAQIQSEPEKLKQVYLSGVILVNACLLPLTALLVITSQELVQVLLGDDWVGGVLTLQILLLTIALRTTVSLSDSLMRAVGAVYQGAWRKAVVALAVIGGSLFGVKWGLPGVAVAVNASLVIRYLLMAQLAMKITGATAREFIHAHSPGSLLTISTTALTLFIVNSMRGAAFPDFVVFTVSTIGSASSAAGLLLIYPGLLGERGNWLLGNIISRMPAQDSRIIRFAARKFVSRR